MLLNVDVSLVIITLNVLMQDVHFLIIDILTIGEERLAGREGRVAFTFQFCVLEVFEPMAYLSFLDAVSHSLCVG